MFNKKFKLLVTAVGLVAVLVVGLVVPGATQQIELPTRAQIVKGLSQLVAMLTASEGDILDVENTGFLSHPQLTAAVIPLHSSSLSEQRLYNWVFRQEPFGDFLNLGALYLENDVISCPPGYDLLKAGIYQMKVRNDLKLIAVDSQGNEFVIGYMKVEHPTQDQSIIRDTIPPPPWVWLVLCLVEDVNIACIRIKECRYVERQPGVYEKECIEKEYCIGC